MKCSVRSVQLELLSVAALWCCIIAFFHKTVFRGLPISRLALLPEWDSLFSQFRTGASTVYDPSLIHIFLPNYFLVAKTFASGVLPLWNPYSGVGCPLIGDIQVSVFSPFHIFFDVLPTAPVYNLSLVGQLFVASTFTYFLGRRLSLGHLSSIFSALVYTFCPYNLWYLEIDLGASGCLFPLVFLFFARAGLSPSLVSAIPAGLTAALLIISGHPESSFFGIFFASLLMLFLMLYGDKLSGDRVQFKTKLWLYAKKLGLAAVSTVAFSAPAFFPFVEYLLNSETYKYVSVCSAHVPWQGIIFNLLNPGVGGVSPFLGIISVLTLPFALLTIRASNAKAQAAKALWLLAAIGFLLVSQIGPIERIFCTAPFTAIITRYGLPAFLLTITLLSAFGLEELAKKESRTKSATIITCLLLLTIAGLAMPYLLRNSGLPAAGNFDLMMPPTAFNLPAWKRDLWCSAGFFVVVCLAQIISRFPSALALFISIVLVFISQGSVAKGSLPTQPKFEYPFVEAFKIIKRDDYRCITCNTHLLKPGSNIVYGVNQLQVHNPLFPKRFLTFIKECGAHVDLFNQEFHYSINPLIDLASVKYVLSFAPVFSSADPIIESKIATDIKELPIRFEDKAVLERLSFWYKADSAAIGGSLRFSSPNKSNQDPQIYYSLVLFDRNNQVLWLGDITHIEKNEPQKEKDKFYIPAPGNLTKSCSVKLGIQVFDGTNKRFIKAQDSRLPEVETSVILKEFTIAPPSSAVSTAKFQLIGETGSHIRVYENTTANPRAYIAEKAIPANSAAESLRAIKNPSFNHRREVVIEDSQLGTIDSAKPSSKPTKNFEVTLRQPDLNHVLLDINTSADGYLVLTDVFYPGWKAYVDGKERKIFRANYLFRAIKIGPDDTSVVFAYEPSSFALGLWTLFSFICILAIAFLIKKK